MTGRRELIPPIWVLNLPRSTERRARISAHLEELGLGFEFVEAIDGRAMSPEECARAVDAPKLQRLLGRQLVPAEVATSLSHARLYRRQVDEGLESVIILEDDAVLDDGFFEVFDHWHQMPPDWEIVSFYFGIDTRTSFWGKRRVGGRLCVKYGSVAFGAVAYMLRLSGARKLLAHSEPVQAPADWLTGGGVRTGIRLHGIYPPCAREYAPGAAHSTMPESYAHYWKPPRQRGPIATYFAQLPDRGKYLFQRLNPFGIR